MPCIVHVGNPPEPCANSTSALFPDFCPLHVDLAASPWDDLEAPGALPTSSFLASYLAPNDSEPDTPQHTSEHTRTHSMTHAQHSPGLTKNSPPIANPETPAPLSPIPPDGPPGRQSPIPRCSALTRNGAPCRFSARKQSGLCINHDPDYKEQQRQNTRKGGQNSADSRFLPGPHELPLDDLDFSSRAEIQATIALIVRLELFGRLSPARTRNVLRALAIATRNLHAMRYNPTLGYPRSAAYLNSVIPQLIHHPTESPPTESTHEKP